MYFSKALVLSAFAAISAASPTILPRQVTGNHGTIVSPVSETTVSSGESFPFSYADSNWCEDGYTPLTVWLTDYAPTTANLNSTGQFPDGEYFYYFGEYLQGNFGLPPLSGSTPPPSTLTTPDISAYTVGTALYLAVVETATDCPPRNQPPQYGLATTALVSA